MKRVVGKNKLISIVLITLLIIGMIATSGMAVFATDEEGESPKITLDLNGANAEDDWVGEDELDESAIEELKSFQMPGKNAYDHDSYIWPPENCEFAGLEITTNKDGKTITALPGDVVTGLDFSEGGHIKYLWKEAYYDVTIHVSTVDGVDQLPPIVIEKVPAATEFEEALKLLDPSYTLETSIFTLPGYSDEYKFRSYKPITAFDEYTDEEEKVEAFIENEVEDYDPIFDNIDVYYCLAKPIDQVKVTVEPPLCGEETDTPSKAYEIGGEEKMFYYWEDQTNTPKVSISDNRLSISDATWIESSDNNRTPYKGTLEGDKTYYLDFEIYPDLGYCLDITEGAIEITGAELEKFEIDDFSDDEASSLYVIAKTKVEHVWGDWEVTKEATEEEEGIETRYCKKDSSHQENRNIPKLPKKEPAETEPTEPKPTGTEGINQSNTSTNKPASQSEASGTNTNKESSKANTSTTNKNSASTKATTSSVPKTGDENNPILFIVIFSLAAVLSVIYLAKTRESNEE